MKLKKKLHRLLSLLLCCVFVLGVLPITAFAKEDEKIPFFNVEMTEPAAGVSIADAKKSISCANPGVAFNTISFRRVEDDKTVIPNETNFIVGNTYRLNMTISTRDGYTFAGLDDVTVQINGKDMPMTKQLFVYSSGYTKIDLYLDWAIPGTAVYHPVVATNCSVSTEYESVPYTTRWLSAPAGSTVFVRADEPELGMALDKFVVEPADVELEYYKKGACYSNGSGAPSFSYDKSYVKFVMPDEAVSITAVYKDAGESVVYDMSVELPTLRPGQTNTDFQDAITLGGTNYYIPVHCWLDSFGNLLYRSIGSSVNAPFEFEEGKTYKYSFAIIPKYYAELIEPYTLKINGKTDGFTHDCWWTMEFNQDTIWCYIYLNCNNDINGTASLSNAYYGSYVNPVLEGEVQELRTTDYSKLHFQWQCSSASGWQDIDGATNLAYMPDEEDVGKYIRIVITADGYTSSVASNGIEVKQSPINFQKPVVPSLSYDATNGLVLTNAKANQEYILTYNNNDPSDWSSAKQPTADGKMTLTGYSTNTTVYVHTRVAETKYKVAGMYSDYRAVYTGEPVNLVSFDVNYSKLSLKVGEVVKLTATPIPANPTNWISSPGIQWYVNGSNATLYKDELCTQPYNRYTDGNAESVYIKGKTQSNWFTAGGERTISGYIPTVRLMNVAVTDTEGNYILERLAFPDVTLARGESVTVDISAYPDPTKIEGTMTFEQDSENPGSTLTLTPLENNTKLKIEVPEDAEIGTYQYTTKLDGTSITTNVWSISVADKSVPVDSVTVLPIDVIMAPGDSMTAAAVISPSNATGTVTWSSSNENVKVDADGIVTVLESAADGETAVITATAGDKYGTCIVNIVVPKYSVTVANGEAYDEDGNKITGLIEAGTYVQLKPTFDSGDDEFSYWSVTGGAATILDTTDPSAYFTMPAEDVTIEAIFKDKILPPSQVTGLTYGVRSADYVSLRWDKDANASGYIVEYLSGDRFVKLVDKTSGSAVSYKVTGLEPGTLYKFRVRSYKTVSGKRVYAAYSDVLKVRTLPTAMTGLTLGARTDTSITLKWDKNESANGAIVEMYSGGAWITVATKTSNSAVSHKITGLKASTAYKFRVRAYINDEEGRIYSVYNVMLNEATAPSAVTNFRTVIAAKTALRFNWDRNTTADGYCIEMVQDGKWVQVTKIESNATIAYAQLKLNPTTTYRFRIRAYKQILGKTIYGAYTTISATTAT